MISATLWQHEGSRLIASTQSPGGTLSFGGAEWQVVLSGETRKETRFVSVTAEVMSGEAKQTSAGLVIEFQDWSSDIFLLLPGVIYSGNRFESRRLGYAPKHSESDCRPDVPTLIADIPRLRTEAGRSRLQLLAGALTTPCVAMFDPRHGTGWILLAPPHVGPDEVGFDFEESDDRSSARLSVTAPGVRERRYRFMDADAESSDKGRDLEPGEKISMSVRIDSFPCQSVQELYDRVFELRKVHVPSAETPGGIPQSAVFRLIEQHYNRTFWSEQEGLYHTNVTNAWSNNPYQTGWCGGIIAEYALLAGGPNELTAGRCLTHLDQALIHGMADGGLFFGKCIDGVWQSDCVLDTENPWRKNLTLTRRQGDALFYLLQAFDVIEAGGMAITAAWLERTRHAAEALVRIWDENGQFGQWIDQFTGRVVIGNSASGAMIPAALCAAEKRFGGGRFLATAIAAAEAYHRNFTRRGFTTGGPGDALQCPDSESSYALVECFMHIHEATCDAIWLDRAGEAARQFATWVMSYDYRFPANSEFGKLGIKSTGAVFANSQNGHAAPGICTHSGLGLLKLFRATGNIRYLELLRDIARSLSQYVSREDRPIHDKEGQPLPSGWINERCNTSDWDDNLGGVFYGPCWCEVSTLLTRAEIPSIYAQPDTGLIAVMDELDAIWTDDGALKISNPTAWPAKVRVLMETTMQARTTTLQPAWHLEDLEIGPGTAVEIPTDTQPFELQTDTTSAKTMKRPTTEPQYSGT